MQNTVSKNMKRELVLKSSKKISKNIRKIIVKLFSIFSSLKHKKMNLIELL